MQSFPGDFKVGPVLGSARFFALLYSFVSSDKGDGDKM